MERTEKELEKLLKLLEESSVVKNYQQAKSQVEEKKDLVLQIQTYQKTMDMYLRKEIMEDEIYRNYQEKSTSLSLFLLSMHLRFRKGSEHVCGLSKANIKEES